MKNILKIILIVVILIIPLNIMANKWSPLQVSIFSPIHFFTFDRNTDIYGLRINLFGKNKNVYGVDVGVVNFTYNEMFTLGVGLLNYSEGEMNGMQLGVCNIAERKCLDFKSD